MIIDIIQALATDRGNLRHISISKSNYLKAMSPLMVGAIISQALSILSIPILARFYPVESFGVFGLVSAIATFSGSFALLKLDSAIAVSSDADPKYLRGIALFLNICFTLVVTVVALLFLYTSEYQYSKILLLIFIFLFVALAGVINVFLANNIRLGNFKVLSKYTIMRTASGIALQVFLGFLWPDTTSFLISQFLSQIIGLLILGPKLDDFKFWRTYKFTFKVVKEYKSFTTFNTYESLISGFSAFLPILIIGHFFGAFYLGIYYMGERLFSALNQVGVESMRTVITNRFRMHANQQRILSQKAIKASLYLLIMSLMLTTFISIVPYSLFSFVIGDKYSELFNVLTLLSVTWIFKIVGVPFYVALVVKQEQNILFKYSLIRLVLSLTLFGPVYVESSFLVFLFWILGLNIILTIIFLAMADSRIRQLFNLFRFFENSRR